MVDTVSNPLWKTRNASTVAGSGRVWRVEWHAGSANGANDYDTIHPTRVDSIKASDGAPPPCNGYDCGDR